MIVPPRPPYPESQLTSTVDPSVVVVTEPRVYPIVAVGLPQSTKYFYEKTPNQTNSLNVTCILV